MHHQFEQGVELGRLIERQRHTEHAVTSLRSDVTEIRAEVTDIRVTLQRWALVASLWGAAISVVLTRDDMAEKIVTLIRAATGKGS